MTKLVRLRNLNYSRIGKRDGGRYYRVGHGFRGGSFFSSLKNIGKTIFQHGKVILPHVLKSIAPVVLSHGAAKLGELASKHGVPQDLVNRGSQLAQKGIQHLESHNKDNEKKLSDNEKKIASFISSHGSNLSAKLLNKASGNGIRGLGIRGLGIRGLGGSGVDLVEAQKLDGTGIRGLGMTLNVPPRHGYRN